MSAVASLLAPACVTEPIEADDPVKTAAAVLGQYGPVRESCTTSGDIIIEPGDDVDNMIEQASAGDVILLRGGTHTLNGSVKVPKGKSGKRIVVKNYDCEQVTIKTKGHGFSLDDYTTLAGFTLDGRGHLRHGDLHIHSDSSDKVVGIIIRNLHILDGDGQGIRVLGNVDDLTIEGNRMEKGNHDKDNGSLIRIKGSPSGHQPGPNIMIRENEFAHCGQEDCFEPKHVQGLKLLDNNWLGPSGENMFDIKHYTGDILIAGNYVDCRTTNTKGYSACVLMHTKHNIPSDAEIIFEKNYLDGCSEHEGDKVLTAGRRATTPAIPIRVKVRDNFFNFSDGHQCSRTIDFGACNDCELRHNTITGGQVRLLKGSNGQVKDMSIRDNIFVDTVLDEQGGSYSCSSNLRHNVSGDMSCNNWSHGDPKLSNPGQHDYSLKSSSPALNAASDGDDLGPRNACIMGSYGICGSAPQPQPEPPASEPVTLPGTLQAESYVDFFDTTPGNIGSAPFDDDVDVKEVPGEGPTVGWVKAGEWLEYDIEVAIAGSYDVLARYARGSSGSAQFHLELDGQPLSGGALVVDSTGSWSQQMTAKSSGLTLPAGPHTLRIVFDSNGVDLNWLELSPSP